MRPVAYYLGIILAEVMIFFLTNLLLVLFAGITGASFYFKAAPIVLPSMFAVAFPFIAFCQLLGMMFNKS